MRHSVPCSARAGVVLLSGEERGTMVMTEKASEGRRGPICKQLGRRDSDCSADGQAHWMSNKGPQRTLILRVVQVSQVCQVESNKRLDY